MMTGRSDRPIKAHAFWHWAAHFFLTDVSHWLLHEGKNVPWWDCLSVVCDYYQPFLECCVGVLVWMSAPLPPFGRCVSVLVWNTTGLTGASFWLVLQARTRVLKQNPRWPPGFRGMRRNSFLSAILSPFWGMFFYSEFLDYRILNVSLSRPAMAGLAMLCQKTTGALAQRCLLLFTSFLRGCVLHKKSQPPPPGPRPVSQSP
jgi:hypothetical protein